MGEFITVAKVDDVIEGRGHIVDARGKSIALFKIDGRIYAIENVCPHRGGPVGEGDLAGKIVTCPWHGWSFDVTTGQAQGNPVMQCKTIAVKVGGGEVEIEV